MVSVKVVCAGKMTGGGRGLTTGRRCGRGGWFAVVVEGLV